MSEVPLWDLEALLFSNMFDRSVRSHLLKHHPHHPRIQPAHPRLLPRALQIAPGKRHALRTAQHLVGVGVQGSGFTGKGNSKSRRARPVY